MLRQEIVNISFSRYDPTFLGFITDTSRKITESALDSAFGEMKFVEAEKIGNNTIMWATGVVK